MIIIIILISLYLLFWLLCFLFTLIYSYEDNESRASIGIKSLKALLNDDISFGAPYYYEEETRTRWYLLMGPITFTYFLIWFVRSRPKQTPPWRKK